jgi:hypothetical protein
MKEKITLTHNNKTFELVFKGRFSCHLCAFYSSSPVGCYWPDSFRSMKRCAELKYIDWIWEETNNYRDENKTIKENKKEV